MDKLDDCEDLIRLIVKAPDQENDDLMVECQLHWTVENLKNHLQEVYPTKPKKEEQKVIFSGQLLNDSMILKDALQQNYNTNEETYTIHLVCPSKSTFTTKKQSINEQQQGNSCNTSSTSSTSSNGSAPSVQEYYSRLNSQQIAWMQQAYTQYLTQYLQLMTAQGVQLPATGTASMPYTQPTNVYTNLLNNPNNSNNASNSNNNASTREDDVRTVNATDATADQNDINNNTNNNNNNNNNVNNNNDNNNNNNNNNAADRDVVLNRDWLDVFDVFARVVVLSSVVYFYSSPSRFLIVTFLGFAIYLIQGGFFRGQQMYFDNNGRGENNNNNNNNNTQNNNNNNANNNANNNGNNNGNNNNNNNGDQANGPVGQPRPNGQINNSETNNQEARTTTNQNEDNERPGALAFTWTFFSSFFASLIPEQPHVL